MIEPKTTSSGLTTRLRELEKQLKESLERSDKLTQELKYVIEKMKIRINEQQIKIDDQEERLNDIES